MGNFEPMALSVNVGPRLRTLREERAISMRELARRSGLSANALSMIERGLTSPSVSTLAKLAYALEIPITALFREEKLRSDVVFMKATQRPHISISGGLWEGLGGETFTGRIEAFMLTLEGGGCSGQNGILHTGHEFVFCILGTIEYTVGDTHYVLEPGDSLLFAAQFTHSWKNLTSQVATAIIVLTGFEDTERPSEFHFISADSK